MIISQIESELPGIGLRKSALESPRNRVSLYFWCALALIVLFAGSIRLYGLGHHPEQFTQDEMVMGYDAWSLWQTGRDHHGDWMPINFKAFNDYVPPIGTYIASPFVGILGLREATSRLPFALMGTLTVLMVGLLGREWFGPIAGALAALFLAIDPWHVNYSRIAFPASTVAFFTVLSLYTFTIGMRYFHRHREDETDQRSYIVGRAWLLVSAICFGALVYTYPTMKVEGPLLLGACLVAAWSLFWHDRKLLVLWLTIYAVCIIPLIAAQLSQWVTIQTHYNAISIFNNPSWPAQMLRLYLDHFNPARYVFSGFGSGVSIRRPLEVGEVFWLELPLWIAAIVGLIRQPSRRTWAINIALLLAIWFVAYPIADSMTRGDSETSAIGAPHEIRSMNVLPLPELAAAYGAVVVFETLRRKRWGNIAVAGLVALGSVCYIWFAALSLSYYFNPPLPGSDAEPYNVGLGTVLNEVVAQMQPCDNIWLQTGNQTYIDYLFLTRYPPQRVQQFDLTHTNGSGTLEISGFDRMSFSQPDMQQPVPPNRPECARQTQRAFYVTKSDKSYPGWQQISVSNDPQGNVLWQGMVKQ